MATTKTCLILLGWASVAFATGRIPVKVRVLEERVRSDVLRVDIETPDQVHSYSLRKVLVRAPTVSSMGVDAFGNITITEIESKSLLALYEDEKSEARFYKNSKKELEGMMSRELALKHEDGQHFVVNINEAKSRWQGTNYATKGSQFAPDIDVKKNSGKTRKESTIRQLFTMSYTVEMTILVDSTMYKNFASSDDLTDYLTVYWGVVDSKFDTLLALEVKVAITHIVISDTRAIDGYFIKFIDEEHADMAQTLSNLGSILYIARNRFKHFDVLHLHTGLMLASVDSQTNEKIPKPDGIAYSKTACYLGYFFAYNIAMVPDNACYSSIKASTKLLTYNLGATDDGKGEASTCSCLDGYIMGCVEDSSRSTHFSLCSENSMLEYSFSSQASCLHTTTNDQYYLYPDYHPGMYKSLVKQCQERSGCDYAIWDYTEPEDLQCVQLSCLIFEEDGSYYHFKDSAPALEGTRCPSGGVCLGGICNTEFDDDLIGEFESGEDEGSESEEEEPPTVFRKF